MNKNGKSSSVAKFLRDDRDENLLQGIVQFSKLNKFLPTLTSSKTLDEPFNIFNVVIVEGKNCYIDWKS